MNNTQESRAVFPHGLTFENPRIVYALEPAQEDAYVVPTVSVQLEGYKNSIAHQTVSVSYEANIDDTSLNLGVTVARGKVKNGVMDFASYVNEKPLQERITQNAHNSLANQNASLERDTRELNIVKRLHRYAVALSALACATLAVGKIEDDVNIIDSAPIAAASIIAFSFGTSYAITGSLEKRRLRSKIETTTKLRNATSELFRLVTMNGLRQIEPEITSQSEVRK